jgi:N-acetylglucosamine kinase-like BadF-type ATPase
MVETAAENGDRIAHKLINDAAQQLALLASAIAHQLFQPQQSIPVAHIGGVFRNRLLLEKFRTVVELHEHMRVMSPVFGPAAGALIEAYRSAGLDCALSNVPEIEK